MTRPPRPDLDPGDRVLVVAHRWQEVPGGRMWLPCGGYRWRTVERIVWDQWCGWQLTCSDPAPHHPSREAARAVVAVLRAAPRPDPAQVPEQLELFGDLGLPAALFSAPPPQQRRYVPVPAQDAARELDLQGALSDVP